MAWLRLHFLCRASNPKGHNPMTQHIEKAALEIWAMVNEDGEYVASHDEDSLTELYDDSIGGTPRNCRTVKLTLTVSLPRGVEVSAELPDDANGETELALSVEG
jgi:hypothetical protein